ncbi:thioredoxin family protein, partial [Candidatus Woesearchaeota archaeon]|nr:thioredoxin family protein [Candidatus Woesearchaeota archaeon]
MDELTKDTFSDFIKEGKVVVDFWAPWCGPCKQMAPEFEAAAPEAGEVKFAKVNTENEGELAGEKGIRGIPTVIFYK